jgi:hypothetical protein
LARRSLLLLLALAVTAATLVAPFALADGDPASDYLITRSEFLPFDAHVGKAQANELAGLLAAAKKKGFELRVAVISSKIDLGAVPILYGKPQTYAHFLGQELFYWYKHRLLVVMPTGYGVYDYKLAPAADLKTVAALPPPRSTDGTKLVEAANRAVRALARQHGVALAAVPAAGSGSAKSSDRLVLGLVVAGALALVVGYVFVRRRLGRR